MVRFDYIKYPVITNVYNYIKHMHFHHKKVCKSVASEGENLVKYLFFDLAYSHRDGQWKASMGIGDLYNPDDGYSSMFSVILPPE